MKQIKLPFLPVPKYISYNGHDCRVTGEVVCHTSAPESASFDYLLEQAGIKLTTTHRHVQEFEQADVSDIG